MTNSPRSRGLAVLLGTACAVAAGASGLALAADIPTFTPAPTFTPVAAPPVRALPSFYIDVDALYMTRRPSSDAALVIDEDENPGDVILNGRDLDFNWRPGLQVRAGTTFGGNLGIDFGGFWLAPFTASVLTQGTGDVAIQTDPNTDLTGIGEVVADGMTRFRGFDANLSYAFSEKLTAFAGVAFLSLQDALDMTLFGNGTAYDYSWAIRNRMIGPQVGMDISLLGDGGQGFFVDATARAGLLFNSMTSSVTSDFPGAGDNIERTRTLMLGGGATAGFNINENFGVHIGYQATFLRNVGLATDQVGMTGNLNQPAIPLETGTGNFLVHGATLGVNLAF
ncbi:MAG: hypothetical protein KIT43_02860 [Bauldia sp.]|nr:hypothetical protein [Bauldia sp.]